VRKSIQAGFTMVELIVVIVILGILAAVALPKFMGLEKEARIAALKSMGGTMMTAAQMARGLCMAQNCAPGATLTIDGKPVVFVNGYPNAASIQNLLQSSEGFTIAGGRLTKAGAATTACWVQYNAATATLPPTIQYQAGVMSSTTETAINTALRTQC
jgi:MSHA pilin protein MshA